MTGRDPVAGTGQGPTRASQRSPRDDAAGMNDAAIANVVMDGIMPSGG
jgi:hypothetical protein